MRYRSHHLISFIALLTGVALWLTHLLIIAAPLLAQNRSWVVPIYQLQGDGSVSPYAEKWVDSYGLVTGVLKDGFYLQEIRRNRRA